MVIQVDRGIFPDGMLPRLITILSNLYQRTTLTFDEMKTNFETTFGVRQGRPESPFLFNLFIDFVMRFFSVQSQNENIDFYIHRYWINSRSINREERLLMRSSNLKHGGNTSLPWCEYADNLILFIQSQSDLQNATNFLERIFERFGLKIIMNLKSKIIVNI